MHSIVKILFGAILLVGSIFYMYPSQYTAQFGAWGDFLTVINGMIPPFVALMGLFIIWLELDEMKVKRELKSKK